MSTTTTFDLDRFTRAAEERDAATQLSMYGPDARVTILDKLAQPGSPRILSTREEIKGWLEDMFGRDMTHKVQKEVQDDDGAAYMQTLGRLSTPDEFASIVLKADNQGRVTRLRDVGRVEIGASDYGSTAFMDRQPGCRS